MGHFSELPGLQDTINFDPDSADFHPIANEGDKLSELRGDGKAVLWPTAEAERMTPEPVMDAVGLIVDGLKRAPLDRGQTTDRSNSIAAAEPSKSPLQTQVLEDLRASNAALSEANGRLNAGMKLAVSAICGNTSAVNDMRIRILLDKGRNQLAAMCGYADWRNLEAQVNNGEQTLQKLQIATKRLLDNTFVSADWKHLIKKDSALQLLIFPREGCGHCDLSSYAVHPQMIAASLSVFEDEEDLLIIFRAVYGSDISVMSEFGSGT